MMPHILLFIILFSELNIFSLIEAQSCWHCRTQCDPLTVPLPSTFSGHLGKNRIGQRGWARAEATFTRWCSLTVAAGEVGFLLTVSGVTRARERAVGLSSWLSSLFARSDT